MSYLKTAARYTILGFVHAMTWVVRGATWVVRGATWLSDRAIDAADKL